MSGQKYYSDGIIHYDSNLGTLYYTPTGGTGNVELTPTSVNWMTTTNFSRTERTKSVWVQGTGTYTNLSFEVPITQDESPLMILLSDIGKDGVPHGFWQDPSSDTPSWIWQYRHTLHTADLGQILDVVVLVNGNVLDVSSETVGGKYLITEITEGNLWVTPTFNLPMVYASSAPDGEYEDYPSGLGTTCVSTYKVTYPVWGENTGKNFDTITNNGTGVISNISVTNQSGAIFDNYADYGETQGLVAVKFQVTVNSSIPDNPSTILIKTAVYNRSGQSGIDTNYPECRGLSLVFTFSDDETELELGDGDDELNFSPAGTMQQGGQTTHNPSINVVSNVPWTITETEPTSQQ